RCIESWMLGNRKIFPKRPTSAKLKGYIEHYDVSAQCPECMSEHDDFLTQAAFHLDYLRLVFKERRQTYSKKSPATTADRYYLEQLIKRSQEPEHLQTFRAFYEFCRMVRGYCPEYAKLDTGASVREG